MHGGDSAQKNSNCPHRQRPCRLGSSRRRPVDDEHRHRRCIQSTIDQVAASPFALAGSELVRVTVNNDEDAAAAVPHIVEGLEKRAASARADHRRFSLQRPHPAQEIPRSCARPRQKPQQSRQRFKRPQRRLELRCHGRMRSRESQASPHWRQLGIARSVAADAA